MKTPDRTFNLYGNSGGCPQNQLDGAQLFQYLVANGYRYVSSPASADVIIINSCAYRIEKEDQSFKQAFEMRRQGKPGAKIILAGCMPKIAPERADTEGSAFVVMRGMDAAMIEAMFPPEQATWAEAATNSIPAPVLAYVKPFRRTLNSGLNALRRTLPYAAARRFDHLFMYDHSSNTFIIRVAEGCLGRCTYCAIRFSRGLLKSTPLETILANVRTAVERGEKEILLCATDLAAYGRDIGCDLSDLLREVLSIARTQYLMLFYANPRWMIDIWEKLEPLFATRRIHFIHLSLNGGSARVLKNMARGYTLQEFETLLRAIKRVSPATVIQTQIITGFPGETEEDFAETLAFLKRNYMHNVQAFAFDPRPGTPAAVMTDQIPPAVRQRRRWQIYRRTLAAKMVYNARYMFRGFHA
jgi:threonylcarbamoyladenosine tRNA methylthiotransferase CDKAL1